MQTLEEIFSERIEQLMKYGVPRDTTYAIIHSAYALGTLDGEMGNKRPIFKHINDIANNKDPKPLTGTEIHNLLKDNEVEYKTVKTITIHSFKGSVGFDVTKFIYPVLGTLHNSLDVRVTNIDGKEYKVTLANCQL